MRGRRLGLGGALLALMLVGCTSHEDRRAALVDGLILIAAAGEQTELAQLRKYLETLGIVGIKRLEVASAVRADGLNQESIELEVAPQDCITPAMIRERTGISFHHLPDGPPPMPPPLHGPLRADPRPRIPSPGIEFQLDTQVYRVVLAIAGKDLKADACVSAFVVRRIAQG